MAKQIIIIITLQNHVKKMKLILITLIKIVKQAFPKKQEHVKNAKMDMKMINENALN